MEVHDIVNVVLPTTNNENVPPAQRARVLSMGIDGIRIRLADNNEEHIVRKEQIQQRVTLPWKPRDLADYFIIFRRKHGRSEEYVDDLRGRRNVIK